MEFKEKQSIYLQCGDHICENILMEVWKETERIPSTREFAADVGVNPNTVVRTYNHLEDLDVIMKKRGIGYFVAENARKIIMQIKKKEFVKNQLPEIFKTMSLLEVSWDEISEYFKEYLNTEND